MKDIETESYTCITHFQKHQNNINVKLHSLKTIDSLKLHLKLNNFICILPQETSSEKSANETAVAF